MITVRITNDYSDGHHSTHEVLCPPVDRDLDEWFQEIVFPHTGDGHGAKYPDLGSFYTAEIIACDNPVHLGETYEWGG